MGCASSAALGGKEGPTMAVLVYDVAGVVYSYLPIKAQGALRSTCHLFRDYFSSAVASELFIGCAICREPNASLGDHSCEWAPFHFKHVPLELLPEGTVVVHPSFVMDPATKKLPNQFLQRCTATKIIVLSSEDVEEFGDDCFQGCRALKHIEFHRMPQLKKIGRSFLSSCLELVFADFSGLVAVEEVHNNWTSQCPNLASINFSNMGKLAKVGYCWLMSCRSISVVDFSPLVSLVEITNGPMSGKTHWMGDCHQLTAESVVKPPLLALPPKLPY